ncbi:MAG: hypothetical protein JRE18_12485 [Deltaproteobacteria bacterium]|jgi:hypothetical protein|nr:hypothetical protein [Deltaproteobacteria bacterium]
MTYNGWRNHATWVIRMWFGDAWESEEDVDRDREFILEEFEEQFFKLPSWMQDILWMNIDDEVDWEELKESCFSTEK